MSSLTGGDEAYCSNSTHEEAEASEKSMVCPGSTKGLLTNITSARSQISPSEIEKVV